VLLVVAGALLAGAAAAVHVAPLGPRLEIDVLRWAHTDSQDVYDLTISSRGGEVIDSVRVEVLRGTARVSPPGHTADLGPDTRYRARVSVASTTPVPAAVRVTMKGPVTASYDIELAKVAR